MILPKQSNCRTSNIYFAEPFPNKDDWILETPKTRIGQSTPGSTTSRAPLARHTDHVDIYDDNRAYLTNLSMQNDRIVATAGLPNNQQLQESIQFGQDIQCLEKENKLVKNVQSLIKLQKTFVENGNTAEANSIGAMIKVKLRQFE